MRNTGMQRSKGGNSMSILKKLMVTAALSAAMFASAANAEPVKIGLVVKSLGNGFFDAANKGAQEAAKELGDVEVIYTGPTSATAEGQIEIINSLIAQNVNAIAISANDPDALVPALKKAMERGITVISWDFGRRAGRPPGPPQPVRHRPDRRDDHQARRRLPARRRRRRDPVGLLDRDQPERLDRGGQEGAAGEVPEDQPRRHRLWRRRLGEVDQRGQGPDRRPIRTSRRSSRRPRSASSPPRRS